MEVTRNIVFGEFELAGESEDDRQADFTALVERQSRFVFQVACAILRNAHDSEDVVQETFLRVYRKAAWTGIRDERAYLARIAWRLSVDRLPVRRSTPPDDELASHEAGPEDLLVTADWRMAVHKLIDALPEELRQPIALTTVRELNSREIAEVMGIPEGTVRTRLLRARRILKQKLAALMERRYEK